MRELNYLDYVAPRFVKYEPDHLKVIYRSGKLYQFKGLAGRYNPHSFVQLLISWILAMFGVENFSELSTNLEKCLIVHDQYRWGHREYVMSQNDIYASANSISLKDCLKLQH